MHAGTKGMKWGVRRWQNEDGTFTAAGKERYRNMIPTSAKEGMSAAVEKHNKNADYKRILSYLDGDSLSKDYAEVCEVAMRSNQLNKAGMDLTIKQLEEMGKHKAAEQLRKMYAKVSAEEKKKRASMPVSAYNDYQKSIEAKLDKLSKEYAEKHLR